MPSSIKSVRFDVSSCFLNRPYPLCVIFRLWRRCERLVYPRWRSIFVKVLSLNDTCRLPAVWERRKAVGWWAPSISVPPPHWGRCRQNSWRGSSAWGYGRTSPCPTLPCKGRRWFLLSVSCCWWAVLQGVIYGYYPYGLGILFRRLVSREPDNLVDEYFGMYLVGLVALFNALVETKPK